MIREMVIISPSRCLTICRLGLGLAVGGVMLASTPVFAQSLEPYTEVLEGTLVTFDMVPVPGGLYEYTDPNTGQTTTVEIKPFWIGKTEVTWDEYDVYRLRLDRPERMGEDAQQGHAQESVGEEETDDPDALARPSKPYGAPDAGFGHQGYATIHITYYAATMYCKWLSLKTGKKYRLPTEAEWEYACRAGQLPAGPIVDTEALGRMAWYADNAEDKAHEVGTKEPNGWGIYDMLGNVAEFVQVSGRKAVVRGGSWRDEASNVHPAARQVQTAAWNMTDPQIPKSKWWLSDAPFIGFRLVCEPPATDR
ncbi:MAG: formylglycine-generating enzyme family protein [Candidatus Zipacnadales bacterium]